MSDAEFDKECVRLADLFGVTKVTMRIRLEDLCKMRQWEGDPL